MRPASLRLARLIAALAVLAVFATACTTSDTMEVNAVFDDVIDLTRNGAVKLADVNVGAISDIALTQDNRALVTMRIDPEIVLPTRVSARLRKTNLLGERFVELVPDMTSGGTLASGATITDTVVVPELEEAIAAGTDIVAAVAADTLAGAIQAGATGLADGRGLTLGALLGDLGTVVDTYDANSADLVRLIQGFSDFLDDTGPQAALHGEAVAELARTARVLAEEDDRLIDAADDLAALSRTGTDIIVTHRRRIDDFMVRLEALTAELIQPESDLDELLTEANGHNFHTIRGINAENAQIIIDFIACGVNDTPGDPVRTCTDAPSGGEAPTPRPPQAFGP